MRRRLSTFLWLCLCGLIVAVCITPAPPRRAPASVMIGATPSPFTRTAVLAVHLEAIDRWYAWASLLPPPKPIPVRLRAGAHRGYATAKECASMVEHNGSYDESDNPTHKGRYQFARSTWIAYGGVPEHWDDWSLATPAEQDDVFERAWNSPGGPSNWLPYDGCG